MVTRSAQNPLIRPPNGLFVQGAVFTDLGGVRLKKVSKWVSTGKEVSEKDHSFCSFGRLTSISKQNWRVMCFQSAVPVQLLWARFCHSEGTFDRLVNILPRHTAQILPVTRKLPLT